MFSHALVLIHICTAVIGLLSGFLSILLRKGSGLHRAAGTIFFVSMLGMTSSAAYLAAFHKPNAANLVVALLTFYLTATGWWAGTRRESSRSMFDTVALVWVLAVGATGITFGFEAAGNPRNMKDGMPAPFYFVFGSIALACGLNDIRMLVRGQLDGARRIARHLWRMSLALLIATLSFFPGQARQLPGWLRQSELLYAPHILLLVSMLFWLYRVRIRKRLPRFKVSRPADGKPARQAPPVHAQHITAEM